MFGWDDLIPVATSVIGGWFGSEGQESTNTANAQVNSAQMAFNKEEAVRNREFQSNEARTQREFQTSSRANQYQTAVGDLRAAGLNPMLAYTNGGAGNLSGAAGSGSQASSGGMIPMGNKMQAGVNAAMAAAQIKNTQAQTELTEAQAEKLRGVDTANVTASTGKIRQETTNLEASLYNIKEEMNRIIHDKDLKFQQGLTEVAKRNLMIQQENVARIEQHLKNGQLTLVEAQTELSRVEKSLKQYATEGAKNEAEFEKRMSTGSGNAATATGKVANVIQAIRKATGK